MSKPKILSSEVVPTSGTTNTNVATIMQEVATLIYTDITSQ
jgi:hypothetical protein